MGKGLILHRNRRVYPIPTVQPKFPSDWVNAQSGVLENNWRKIIWSPELGIFVAVADSGNTNERVMVSSDGFNWQNAQSGVPNTDWLYVEWSPELSLFVAVGAGGNQNERVMISTDGLNWTTVQVPDTQSNHFFTSVVWSSDLNSFFLFKSEGFNTQTQVFQSFDGISWSQVPSSGQPFVGRHSTWVSEYQFLIAGGSSHESLFASLFYSTDNGVSWTNISGNYVGNDLVYSPELDIFVLMRFGNVLSYMFFDEETNTFDTPFPDFQNSGMGLAWSPELGVFVAVGPNARYSFDGINWTMASSGVLNNAWNSVSWSPELGIFVAVAGSGDTNERVMISNGNLPS